jgi:hypothetical protein
MPTDNRISSMPEVSVLYSDIEVVAPPANTGQNDDDVLFLITRSGVKSEKITFKSLKSSIVANTVSLTGNQLISGEKTFADTCIFEDTVFLNEVIDTNYEGDISGYNFVAQTGRFDSVGLGVNFANKTRSPEYDVHVEGDINIEGNFASEGDLVFDGDSRFNNVIVSGNLTAHGGVLFESGLSASGDVDITGSISVSGDLNISNKISQVDNPDSYIELSGSSLKIAADANNYIHLNEQQNKGLDVVVSGEKKFSINESGQVAINTDTNSGTLTVAGDAYLENLYVTGSNGSFEKVFAKSYDESMQFTTNLNPGRAIYEIDFPKTFGTIPTVHVGLQNDAGEPPLAFNISNITTGSYFINFEQDLVGENYQVTTNARVLEKQSVHQTSTQAFSTSIIEGEKSYEINFPESFAANPVVTVTLEKKYSPTPEDPGAQGETFLYGWEYYIATQDNAWRRVTSAEVFRDPGTRGDIDFDNDFYYICLDDTLWGKIPLTIADITPEDLDADGFDFQNGYIYVNTNEGWKQAPIATWPFDESPTMARYTISNIDQNKFTINFAEELSAQYNVHILASR